MSRVFSFHIYWVCRSVERFCLSLRRRKSRSPVVQEAPRARSRETDVFVSLAIEARRARNHRYIETLRALRVSCMHGEKLTAARLLFVACAMHSAAVRRQLRHRDSPFAAIAVRRSPLAISELSSELCYC